MKVYRLMLLLVVVSLIIAACGAAVPVPAPTEAPAAAAPAATEEPAAAAPAVTEEPAAVTEEPVAKAPAATEEAAAEAPASSDAECVRVASYESSGDQMSMDPAILYSGHDATYTYAVYERLVDATPDFNVVPQLAESWEQNEDATEWTFHLRQGVKFHDGSDFDANDVVYTYQRILDEKTGSSGFAVLSPVLTSEGVTAKDDHTVVFTTKEPVVALPLLLTTKETGIVPEGAKGEDLTLKGNGTGPFMQESFEPGNEVVRLTANPDYWQEGLPKAPCLEVRVVQEATTTAAALQSGDIDIALQVDAAVLPTLQGDPNIQLMPTGAGNSMTFSMFTDTPPFDDIKVRDALKMVIDREEMVQTVLLGYGEAGADNPIPISDPMSFLNGQEAPKQDIEGAKKLLAEAGYDESNPLKFDLYTSEAIPGHTRMSEVFKEQAAEAGIEVNIIVTPAESFWDDVWLKQSFVTSAWSRRPVGIAEGMAYTCESQFPETHWCREEFDQLLAKAGTTVDEAERTKLYHDLQKMVTEDGGAIIPMFVHAVAGMRTECTGWEPHVQNFNLDYSTVECKR
jgi:peptide/nickel transport system substrate-binding protein